MVDTTEELAQTSIPTPVTTQKKKRKRTSKPHIITQLTIRHAPWAYVHLEHLSAAGNKDAGTLDALTAHLHITAALSQFLGLHGSAIPVDILKLDGMEVWVRLPREEKSALIAAVGGWVSGAGEGWRVRGSSSWDARTVCRDGGQDLFED